VEDISGEALGVDADDGGRGGVEGGGLEVAHDEGYGRLNGFAGGITGGGEAFKAEDAEVSPTGGEVGIGDLGDAGEGHDFIIDSRGVRWIQSGLLVPSERGLSGEKGASYAQL